MLVVFWIERYFYIILIARIHPTANFYTYEQAKNFLNPANAKCSSQESLKENCHTFIGMCSVSLGSIGKYSIYVKMT